MKKFLASSIVIVGFVLYALLHNKSEEITATHIPVSLDTSTNASYSTPSPTSHSMQMMGHSTQFKDGEYTGVSADAYYGYIKVKAIIQHGRLTDITFLDYPRDHHESQFINNQALPILKEEAIQAQSANVDVVTRATDSSLAFRQSLASALQSAQQ